MCAIWIRHRNASWIVIVCKSSVQKCVQDKYFSTFSYLLRNMNSSDPIFLLLTYILCLGTSFLDFLHLSVVHIVLAIHDCSGNASLRLMSSLKATARSFNPLNGGNTFYHKYFVVSPWQVKHVYLYWQYSFWCNSDDISLLPFRKRLTFYLWDGMCE